ncbi:MAG TPA: glutaredoxin family protein [Candidatus Nanoarchaeia archaeon]|nr:glutaredoxin family protein [Candidatus Nanoarchaeia archaeon]
MATKKVMATKVAKKVTVYSTPTCQYCKMAKEWLKEHKIAFTEVNVADDEEARNKMIEKSGEIGVPQIEIGSKIIVGFDKEALEKELL